MEARLEPAHIADREAPQVSEPAPAPEPERLSHESERLAVPGLSRPGSAEPIRRKPSAEDPLGGTSVQADTARRLAGSATSGRALDPKVRGPLESAFRADFGDVNVHTDGNAAQLARDVVGALRRQAVSCGPTGHDHSAHDHGALDPEPG